MTKVIIVALCTNNGLGPAITCVSSQLLTPLGRQFIWFNRVTPCETFSCWQNNLSTRFELKVDTECVIKGLENGGIGALAVITVSKVQGEFSTSTFLYKFVETVQYTLGEIKK